MTESISICPHLGLSDDRTLVRTQADTGHRCYVQTPPAAPGEAHQQTYCLGGGHGACPLYVAPAAQTAADEAGRPSRRSKVILPSMAAVMLLLVVVGVVYRRDLLAIAVSAQPSTAAVILPAVASATPAAASRTPLPTSASPAAAPRFATPTPVAGGRVVSLSPRAGDAGWWASGDERGNHLGDSYLYSGYFEGKVFVAAVRFDVRAVTRGAPIRGATLRLTGLQGDRFRPEAGGTWSIQLLPADGVEDLGRATFQKLFNAPSAVSLFPQLYAADLGERKVNQWGLEAAGRDWLAQQIAGGAESVLLRIIGPAGGAGTLFAWDSGSGPATAGEAPQLVLSLGPAPSTPIALPTQPVVVATWSPTPANVLTAAANARTATAVAGSIGTFTAVPANVVTPTPLPANMATAQAQGYRGNLPPLVVSTPIPANGATATANAAYATAVAMTTGTFTPVPTNAVTPVIVNPTPMPENVMTAAAQSIAATARVKAGGTPTPLPYGVVIATVTPGPYVLIATSTPENNATAAVQVAYATAVAFTTGTFTPMPPGGRTPTPTPAATPLPLLMQVTPRPTPSPTPGAPGVLPDAMRGKILFRTDRDGAVRTFLLDPASGQVLWVTQEWPFPVAQLAEGKAPDGKQTVIVRDEPIGHDYALPTGGTGTDYQMVAQLIVLDARYGSERQITHGARLSYDAAWSPRGDQIVYVSQEPGNDEIFTIDPEGKDAKRLTQTTWEWNKHPSWSPDGSQIVFWSNRETGRRQLWIMKADGSDQRRLLDSPYSDWDPIWVK